MAGVGLDTHTGHRKALWGQPMGPRASFGEGGRCWGVGWPYCVDGLVLPSGLKGEGRQLFYS